MDDRLLLIERLFTNKSILRIKYPIPESILNTYSNILERLYVYDTNYCKRYRLTYSSTTAFSVAGVYMHFTHQFEKDVNVSKITITKNHIYLSHRIITRFEYNIKTQTTKIYTVIEDNLLDELFQSMSYIKL